MGFHGFAENERRQVLIPEQFFRELLAEIDDLDELRLTLNIFWRLQRQEGPFRAVRWRDLVEDDILSKALGGKRKVIEAALEGALSKAEQRGSLLAMTLETEDGEERLVLLNSPRGRAALAAIRRGDLRLSSNPVQPLKFAGERPNVYQLYEASIGPLTPMIAEALALNYIDELSTKVNLACKMKEKSGGEELFSDHIQLMRYTILLITNPSATECLS